MTSQPQSKKYLGLILIIALLLAGLFYFLRPARVADQGDETAEDEVVLKPSQMNFAESNHLPAPQPLQESGEPVMDDTSGVQPLVPYHGVKLQPEDQQKMNVLDEILKSRNDNDPRLDTELKNLSLDLRKALVAKYNSMIPEDRNGRGTIVFLIARELQSAADLEFLTKVYQENPCLSMGDCRRVDAEGDRNEVGGNNTSVNYPQLAGLYQAEARISRKPELLSDPAFRAGFVALLNEAENFAVPQVHDRAVMIRKKYGL